MKKWLFILALLSTASLSAQSNRTVFPAGFENQNGDLHDSILIAPYQIQELFRASSLTPTWQGPVSITAIAFRVNDGNIPRYNSVIPQLEVRLSTSSRAPEQMVLNYLQNRGPDEKTVYLHSSVALSGASRQPINPFDLRLTFDQPFFYDSRSGNLFMYISTGTGGAFPGASTIDSQGFSDLSSTPVAAVGESLPAGGGQLVLPYSLITQFSWVSVPEPSSLTFMFAGACSLYFFRKKPASKNAFHPPA
jgi:hypothetical protein